jgi:hypothetical protein
MTQGADVLELLRTRQEIRRILCAVNITEDLVHSSVCAERTRSTRVAQTWLEAATYPQAAVAELKRNGFEERDIGTGIVVLSFRFSCSPQAWLSD